MLLPKTANWRKKFRDSSSWLLVAFGFILPFSVAVDGILAGVVALVALLGADRREDWEKLKKNRLVWAVLAFYLLNIVGMLWTEDIASGVQALQKESLLLFMPVFMLAVRKEHLRYYAYSFLAAMALQVFLSYAIWFGLLPPFNIATLTDPVPFMGHITYNPFLAFAIYFLFYFILFDQGLGMKTKAFFLALLVPFVINMFITQGRSGQVVFFVMVAIVVFQYYERYFLRAMLVSVIAIASTFVLMYGTNDSFKGRVDQAVWDLNHYDTITWSAVGARITFARNSFEILKRNPFFGVGTGDFNVEYHREHLKTGHLYGETTNPHNMYSLEAVQFGALGLLTLVSILAAQIYEARRSNESFRQRFGIALPIMFAVLMFGDTYLRGFFTTMLFTYLSAFTFDGEPDGGETDA